MKLIKSAIVYKATIPTDTTTLHNHLAERAFTECAQNEAVSVGFVPPREGCRLVAEFPGGMAWSVRVDTKIIPGAVLKAKTDAYIKEWQQQHDRKPPKSIKAQLKDTARDELAAVAFTRTAVITCYYWTETQHLIVATSSTKLADIATSLLVHAVGSVKTETLNISNVKHGLTTRLKHWLDGDEAEAFGEFQPVDQAALALDGKRLAVRMSNLEQARDGLRKAIEQGFTVTSLGFHWSGSDFRLTENFHLKGLAFEADELVDADSEEELWAADATMQTERVSKIVTELCELLAYQEPEQGGEAEAEAVEA